MRRGALLAAMLAIVPADAARAEAMAWPRGGVVRVQGDGVGDIPRVITHTRAYCEELSARAGQLRLARGAVPAEADLLAAEGDRLCAHGQIRPGIMRLRRAIMLLRAERPADR